jgi:signal peptidase I
MPRKKIWPWFVLGALALILLARFTLFDLYRIPAGSMIPTLQVGDNVIVNRLARAPSRGDVIVFRYPKDPTKDFIKRVIGVGGDTVELRAGEVWLNGAPLPYLARSGPCVYKDYDEGQDRWSENRCRAFEEELGGKRYTVIRTNEDARSFAPVVVPDGNVYVLGDNRDNSHDSRYWGFVPDRDVRGTLWRVWYSAAR